MKNGFSVAAYNKRLCYVWGGILFVSIVDIINILFVNSIFLGDLIVSIYIGAIMLLIYFERLKKSILKDEMYKHNREKALIKSAKVFSFVFLATFIALGISYSLLDLQTISTQLLFITIFMLSCVYATLFFNNVRKLEEA